MTTDDATTNEILDFLHENMVTKEEFKIGLDETKAELRGEMNKMKLDIFDHMDDKLADLE